MKLIPVIPPLAWADGIIQAREVVKVIRTLPDLLGFLVKTIGGISNLGTHAPDRDARLTIEQSYVAMLASAGLEHGVLMTARQFDFDYLVVGSGFGGSVSAMRLAQKGYRVGVSELCQYPVCAAGFFF